MGTSEQLKIREKKFENLLLKTKDTDLIIAYAELKESIGETMKSALNALTSKKNKRQPLWKSNSRI